MNLLFKLGCGFPLAVLLTACGGGGGGGGAATTPTQTGPVTSTLSFPLGAAMKTSTANGETITLTANGTSATQAIDGLCSGTITSTSLPANVATTFEGVFAFSAVTTANRTYTNCTPSNSSGSYTNYYDANYLPLGSSLSGGRYSKWLTTPNVPNFVTVGASGVIGTENYYTDSTKATLSGRTDVSFVVEPETATTAIFNLISKDYDQSNQLTSTSQDRRRIDAAGNSTLLSSDVQYATPPATHLVFRR